MNQGGKNPRRIGPECDTTCMRDLHIGIYSLTVRLGHRLTTCRWDLRRIIARRFYVTPSQFFFSWTESTKPNWRHYINCVLIYLKVSTNNTYIWRRKKPTPSVTNYKSFLIFFMHQFYYVFRYNVFILICSLFLQGTKTQKGKNNKALRMSQREGCRTLHIKINPLLVHIIIPTWLVMESHATSSTVFAILWIAQRSSVLQFSE
jgi:hypothetical protein